MAKATLSDICKYFRLPSDTLRSIKSELDRLSDEDRAQIAEGIGNGTLTY